MSTIISQSAKDLAKQKPFFLSRIMDRKKLSKKGSTKSTYLLKMDLSDFKEDFLEGDAFSIRPVNDPQILKDLLDLLKLDGKETICHPKLGLNFSLLDFLKKEANLGKVSSKLLSLLTTCPSKKQDELLRLTHEDKRFEKKSYLASHDVLSFLEEVQPENLQAQAFIETLLPLLPRFYSCASSFSKQKNSVDFLITTFEHEIQGSFRKGLSSDYLCHRAKLHSEEIEMHLHKNFRFQLPKDSSLPIIMIGPGTGVAPFRAFVQKRIANKALSNWLFFGERNSAYDYYFEDEWQSYQKNHALKLSLAFSRDQKKKLYVQNKLYEHRKEFLRWLEKGAIVYVCGDAKKMEKDVRSTIMTIFKEELSISDEDAQKRFKELYSQKRYLTDVY